MAGTSNGGNRRERESDSMEALKPLVVLALFGMILYGAYTVVQKGPSSEAAADAGSAAPPFAPPEVQVAAPQPTNGPLADPVSRPDAAAPPAAQVAVPATPQPPATTFLPAESAPPPSPDQVPTRTGSEPLRLDADPSLPPAQLSATPEQAVPDPQPPLAVDPAPPIAPTAGDGLVPPTTTSGGASSAAFASAWADAHDKLAAGRYAEALTALSVWYDDPALGLEESQRLEDLLGQLAGTVIYSQQDLLMPPHVVAPGETLPAVAGPLGVSPQLLAKINGIEDPQRLVPGEHIKVVRGPFDAVVSVSRRRVSLQLNGAYAGSFPAVVGRRYLEKVGASLPVVDVRRGAAAAPGATEPLPPRTSIVLGEGLVIEAVDDPVAVADAAPQTSLVMSVRDLEEMLDILGPTSRVLVRQ